MNALDNIRHAEERGKILRTLAEQYGEAPVTLSALLRLLDSLGHSMSPDGMQFHLNYLADSGYVKLVRVRDLPGFRTDRAFLQRPESIVSARIMPLGIRLMDGTAAADGGVLF